MIPNPDPEGPCGSYFGNLCTGFGARALCELCGWDRHEHSEQKRRIAEIFGTHERSHDG